MGAESKRVATEFPHTPPPPVSMLTQSEEKEDGNSPTPLNRDLSVGDRWMFPAAYGAPSQLTTTPTTHVSTNLQWASLIFKWGIQLNN